MKRFQVIKRILTPKRIVAFFATTTFWIILLLLSCMDTYLPYWEILQLLLYLDCGIFGGLVYGVLLDYQKEMEMEREKKKRKEESD